MAAPEFTVSDVRYSTTKMNAMTQFHVSRRLAPLMAVIPLLVKGRKPGDLATPVSPEQVREVLEATLTVVGEMKDADVDYVLDACLSTVARWDPRSQSWQAAWNAAARRPMYEDINMIVMVMICFHVLKESLGPFTFASSIGLAA